MNRENYGDGGTAVMERRPLKETGVGWYPFSQGDNSDGIVFICYLENEANSVALSPNYQDPWSPGCNYFTPGILLCFPPLGKRTKRLYEQFRQQLPPGSRTYARYPYTFTLSNQTEVTVYFQEGGSRRITAGELQNPGQSFSHCLLSIAITPDSKIQCTRSRDQNLI